MAKTFNDIIMEANQSVYSKKVNALILAAKGVPGVDFSPVLAPNGKTDGTTSKYTVQRRKRPAVNTVANANTGTTAAALAALDQFTESDWDSLPVATGALRSVGFKELINDDFDFSNSPRHAKDIMYQVGEVATQRHKDILALLATATKTGAALPAYAAASTAVWDAISDEVIKLSKVDDEFMDVQHISDFYIVVSNTVAKELAKEMGQIFNQEAPIAQTGFKTNMSVNGTPVIVDTRLTAREVYIAHNEAIAFGKVPVKNVSVDLGLTAYTGEFFYDIMVIVDAARVKQFGTVIRK